ncbi:MAG TPA: acylphosphatase [Dermatophilaceae bacterium]|nr:acylphosphatase [Dermatophilaceae bacterium]
MEDITRATVFLRGDVQGVGMRWWVRARALELGLAGHARNTDDGRVEVVAQGPRDRVEELLRLLVEQPSTRRRPGTVVGASHPVVVDRPPGPLAGFAER